MSQPTALSSLLHGLFARQGWDDRIRAHEVWCTWDQVVGPQIASQARPARLRGDVLEVKVNHPIWMQQLQLMKPKLLAALNSRYEKVLIRDLFFRPGRIAPPPKSPKTTPAPWKEMVLSEEDMGVIEQQLASCTDPALQRELRRLYRKQRQLDRYRQEISSRLSHAATSGE